MMHLDWLSASFYMDFTGFSIFVLFLFQDLILTTTLHLVAMLPPFPLAFSTYI